MVTLIRLRLNRQAKRAGSRGWWLTCDVMSDKRSVMCDVERIRWCGVYGTRYLPAAHPAWLANHHTGPSTVAVLQITFRVS